MDELIEILAETENCHDGFRVWITTEGHPHFPISLLQVGDQAKQTRGERLYFFIIKMTNLPLTCRACFLVLDKNKMRVILLYYYNDKLATYL